MKNNSTKPNIRNDKGSIIILNTLVFMMISVSIIVGLSQPITNNFSFSKSYIEKEQILISMDSLANEILYKIRNFDDINTDHELILNSKKINAVIEDVDVFGLPIPIGSLAENNFKQITITSEDISDFTTIRIEKDSETGIWNVIFWFQN